MSWIYLKGNFKDATLKLEGNQLTRLDETVFKPIINQMKFGKGNINVHNSKF